MDKNELLPKAAAIQIICQKCKRVAPVGAVFCAYCGKKLIRGKRTQKTKNRGNGQGTAYKRGNSWVSCVTYDWKENPEEGKPPIPVRATKGGFRTKGEALAYCPILKGEKTAPKPVEQPRYTLQQVYDMWEPWYEPRVKSMAGYKSAFKYFSDLYSTPMRRRSAA